MHETSNVNLSVYLCKTAKDIF